MIANFLEIWPVVTKQAKNRLKNVPVEENTYANNTSTTSIVRKATVVLPAVYRPVSLANQLIPRIPPWNIHTYTGKNR